MKLQDLNIILVDGDTALAHRLIRLFSGIDGLDVCRSFPDCLPSACQVRSGLAPRAAWVILTYVYEACCDLRASVRHGICNTSVRRIAAH